MQKYISIVGLNTSLDIVMGAMNLQNENYGKAYEYLFAVLK